MSAQETKAAARRIYETLNEALRTGNLALMDEVITTDGARPQSRSWAGSRSGGDQASLRRVPCSVPDLQLSVKGVIAESDKVACRITSRGMHRGAFLGVPATGKKVTQTGIDILRIADGKIIERCGEFDSLGLMQHLDLVPSPK